MLIESYLQLIGMQYDLYDLLLACIERELGWLQSPMAWPLRGGGLGIIELKDCICIHAALARTAHDRDYIL